MYNRHLNSLRILSRSTVNACSYTKLHDAFFVRTGNREKSKCYSIFCSD